MSMTSRSQKLCTGVMAPTKLADGRDGRVPEFVQTSGRCSADVSLGLPCGERDLHDAHGGGHVVDAQDAGALPGGDGGRGEARGDAVLRRAVIAGEAGEKALS